MIQERLHTLYTRLTTGLLALLCIGTPLIFTPLTRSVFEVNKLLLLRIITLLVMGLWLTYHWLTRDESTRAQPPHKQWTPIGLEKPFLAWIALNIVSTIFSQNVVVAIIGAYDRWEGIITILNYVVLYYMFAKLVQKKWQLTVILTAIVVPAVFSSMYGVFQSLGLDFMAWSQDPTMRVFACINNPVHFCAYVGMCVPLCLGWLLHVTTEEHQHDRPSRRWIKWAIFLGTILIYYAQFLSFSRATWLGFVGSMTLFYLVATDNLDLRSPQRFFKDFLFTGITIGALYLTEIFKLHQSDFYLNGLPTIAIICVYLWTSFLIEKHRHETQNTRLQSGQLVEFFGLLGLLFFNFLTNLSQWGLSDLAANGLHIGLSVLFIALSMRIGHPFKTLLSRLVIILIFTKLQYVQISLLTIFHYGTLVVGYYFLALKGNPTLLREKKGWLLSFLAIFAMIIIIPTLPIHLGKFINVSGFVSDSALFQVEGRVRSYEKDALKGTARTSMWKTAVPWTKDHLLIGSGPDTVKYMYPTYRRADYGILEGGHNFTPDRLHNEYINTMATRGLLGFFIYYVGIIGGWLWLILRHIPAFRHADNPHRYLLVGLTSGALVYLGQVLFNFGVVATMVLFYIFLGLAHAIAVHKGFQVTPHTDQTKAPSTGANNG